MEQVQFHLNVVWTVTAALLVFLMQAGFMALEAGAVRAKNAINVVMKNVADMVIVAIVFLLIGFPLMFGKTVSGLFGMNGFFLWGHTPETDPWLWTFLLFQIMFAGTSATIVSGAIAERAKFSTYIFVCIFSAMFIYPLFGHWAWGSLLYTDQSGWLGGLGFMDFAGSTVVHSIGAWIALAGILVIGPRLGKYAEDGTIRPIVPSNMPLMALGVFLLWFGWFGFNAGSTTTGDASIAMIALNTLIGGAGGGTGALFFGYLTRKVWKVEDLLNGILAGLVSVTAGCNVLLPQGALLAGIVGGIIYVLSYRWMDEVLKLDDAVGAVAVHGFAGVWGTLALALLAPAEWLVTGSRMQQLFVQTLGAAVAFGWAFFTGLLLFLILKVTIGVRVTPEEEQVGLNVSEHDAKIALVDTILAMQEIAASKGDLTHTLPVYPGDDTAQLNEAFNRMLRSLNKIVKAVQTETRSVMDNSGSVLQQTQSISQHMQQFAESVHHVNAAVQQLRSIIEIGKQREETFLDTIRRLDETFQEYAAKMHELQRVGNRLAERTKHSDQDVQQIVATMDRVREHMENIHRFIGDTEKLLTILDEFGEQIHMLSLNARIEAARSNGEMTGFAVVAHEIKHLAEQTRVSLSALRKPLEKHMNESLKGVQVIAEAHDILQKLTETMVEMFRTISNITEEMGDIEGETRKFLERFNALSHDTDKIRQEKQQQFSRLEEIAQHMEMIGIATDHIATRIHEISESAHFMHDKAKLLGEQVASFKTS